MDKHLILKFVLFIFPALQITHLKAECRKDTIYATTIEYNILYPQNRIINQFNNQNIPIESIKQEWNSVSKIYVNSFRETYTYHSNGKLSETLIQIWNVTDWKNYAKEISTFDANGNTIEFNSQNWTSTWEDRTRIEYLYNAGQKQTRIITSSWNYYGNNIWDKRAKDSMVYDLAQNKTETYHYDFDQTTFKWKAISLLKYNYNLSNLPASVLALDWDKNKWDSSYRTNYIYDANNQLTQELSETWSNTFGLYLAFKTSYNYNSDKNITEKLQQAWNPADKVWRNFFKDSYTYDGNGNLISKSVFFIWNETSNAFNLEEKEEYKCTYILSINSIYNTLFKIYPNPAGNSISFETTEHLFNIEIYDVHGALLLQKTEFTEPITAIDVLHFNSGIYIIKCHYAKGVYAQKILIQH